MRLRDGLNIFIVVVGACLFPLAPASADAIDGNWCSKKGRTLSIDGPKIVTPGGTSMTGDYDRHGFSYKVPANEPSAGAMVSMSLVDDDTMHLNPGQAAAKEKMQIWRRCKLST